MWTKIPEHDPAYRPCPECGEHGIERLEQYDESSVPPPVVLGERHSCGWEIDFLKRKTASESGG